MSRCFNYLIFLWLGAAMVACQPDPSVSLMQGSATPGGIAVALPFTPPPTVALGSVTSNPLPTPSLAWTETPAGETPFPTEKASYCSVVGIAPKLDPTLVARFPPQRDGDWALGSDQATVTFVEYIDFQSPYCAVLEPILLGLQRNYADDLRLVYRHLPLPPHNNALMAAQAADAAGLQDKDAFFRLSSALLSTQQEWDTKNAQELETFLINQARQTGVDIERFKGDLKSETAAGRIRQSQQEAVQSGIAVTPFLLINGQPYQGPTDYASLETIVRLMRLAPRQATECPPITINTTKQYQATLKTSKGEIVIQLYPDKAPIAVNNFIFLTRRGWFDDVPFHRVVPGFVAQAGDPSGTGYGGPGYAFSNEIVSDLLFDSAGVVGMANAGPTANGSQFFITYAAAPQLDGKYTIFGRVVKGMDVAELLTASDPAKGSNALALADRIISVKIEEQE